METPHIPKLQLQNARLPIDWHMHNKFSPPLPREFVPRSRAKELPHHMRLRPADLAVISSKGLCCCHQKKTLPIHPRLWNTPKTSLHSSATEIAEHFCTGKTKFNKGQKKKKRKIHEKFQESAKVGKKFCSIDIFLDDKIHCDNVKKKSCYVYILYIKNTKDFKKIAAVCNIHTKQYADQTFLPPPPNDRRLKG